VAVAAAADVIDDADEDVEDDEDDDIGDDGDEEPSCVIPRTSRGLSSRMLTIVHLHALYRAEDPISRE
jgi:hypothetical protein